MSRLYCRFQSGRAPLSGGSSYHPGSSVGWGPHRQHVYHDGGDDGTAGTAYGMSKETQRCSMWLSDGHYGCKGVGVFKVCSNCIVCGF